METRVSLGAGGGQCPPHRSVPNAPQQSQLGKSVNSHLLQTWATKDARRILETGRNALRFICWPKTSEARQRQPTADDGGLRKGG